VEFLKALGYKDGGGFLDREPRGGSRAARIDLLFEIRVDGQPAVDPGLEGSPSLTIAR
jgi:hypothetical protein